jgi:hypothetical protein
MRVWLKIRILTKYGSQAKFARSCDREDSWISRIIVGRQTPSAKEKALILEKLGARKDEEYLFSDYR